MNNCYICGNPNVEIHHIVYRSHVPFMKDAEINLVGLCPLHHRDGKQGVHFNKNLDLRLKQELQLQLTLLFTKEFYSEEEIRKMLGINKKQVARLVKTIQRQNDGYPNTLIVKRCLGDRFYE